jgi:hypothetical protein
VNAKILLVGKSDYYTGIYRIEKTDVNLLEVATIYYFEFAAFFYVDI